MLESDDDKFMKCLSENKKLKNQLQELKDTNFLCNNTLKENKYTIEKLTRENKKLKHRIKNLENNRKILEDKNESLENTVIKIKKDLAFLINKEKIREAFFKLHEIDSISNKTFKNEYMKYFTIKKFSGEYIPNLSEFIQEDQLDNEKQNFWSMFLNKYPGSDNKNFILIYRQFNSDRMDFDAFLNINDISEKEFDELVKIALPDINRSVIESYKNWIYSFTK